MSFHPLRDRLRARLIDEAVAKGATTEAATAAVDQLATDRPLLDWLLNGGFAKVLQLVMELIALFQTPAPQPALPEPGIPHDGV